MLDKTIQDWQNHQSYTTAPVATGDATRCSEDRRRNPGTPAHRQTVEHFHDQ